MKVTKYPQSCLVVEVRGVRMLIDPGSFVSKKYPVTELLPIDAILITHEHADHIDPLYLADIVGKTAVAVYCNASTAKLLGDLATNIVKDGDVFMVDGVAVIARELPHVKLVNGSDGPQNTGYVIANTLFHPGDGIKIDNLQITTLAVPIAGPDISPRDVCDFVESVGAKKVIPIHNDYFKANQDLLNHYLKAEVIHLADGESVEL